MRAFCILLLSLVLVACGGGGSETPQTDATDKAESQASDDRSEAEPSGGGADRADSAGGSEDADPNAPGAAAKPADSADESPAATAKDAPKGEVAKRDKPAAKAPAGPHPGLLDPSQANEQAPAEFNVEFETTKGSFLVKAVRSWAPLGVDRFYNMVKIGYFKDIAFFRMVPNFVCQFGIHGDPSVSARWRPTSIPDDPVKQSNLRGYLTFATGGPNTRTVQLFINYKDNANLDSLGFAPIGQVVAGMEEVVDQFNFEYQQRPNQGAIQQQGNTYLKSQFPNLDYILSARIK